MLGEPRGPILLEAVPTPECFGFQNLVDVADANLRGAECVILDAGSWFILKG